MLAYALEHLLDKRRILEIYLNNVEWGQGVFGAEAAARHYFGTSAKQLSAAQAARLAVMLPAPKRFEKSTPVGLPDSARPRHPRAHGGDATALRAARFKRILIF